MLRAPTNQTAAASLEVEKKLYVEFFDSFEEDKRSRCVTPLHAESPSLKLTPWRLLLECNSCWMQKKNVESFDDSFDERASKSIGKSFPKFVDGTQRAEANGSPMLFAGMGTLPIEFSTKTPSTFAVQKKKYGTQWPSMYKTFSDRYYSLYGFESSKGKRSSELVTGALSDDEDEDDGVDISALAAKDRTPKRKTAAAAKKPAGKRKAANRKGYTGTTLACRDWEECGSSVC